MASAPIVASLAAVAVMLGLRLTEAVGLGGGDPRADLEVPQELEAAAGGVVVEAGEAQERGLAVLARGDGLDQPLAAAGGHHLAGMRDAVEGGGRGGGLAGEVEAGGGGELGDEVLAGSMVEAELVGAGDGPQLVAAELAQDVEQAGVAEGPGEELGDLRPGLPGGAEAGAEDAAEVEEPLAGEGAEDGRGGGLGHGDRAEVFIYHERPAGRPSAESFHRGI